MGVMVLFHFQKMFSFQYFFLKRLICVLDSYFIHRYIIIKYGQVPFKVKSANYYESYGPFFNFIFFAKYLRVVEDDLERGHLCHTDTFLVIFKENIISLPFFHGNFIVYFLR